MITQCEWIVKNSDLNEINIAEKISKIRDIPLDRKSEDAVFYDPYEINDMEIAVYEICAAIQNCKKILIYGDYDVDGMCSTISLYKFLLNITPYVQYYIPNRFTDGYGLSEKITTNIINNIVPDLVITVDNGITANDCIEKLRKAGIKVVVTDHHICPPILPSANAVVNCHRTDNTYPFQELCGTGVVLKLIQALSIELSDYFEENEWEKYIEYATLATIADVVPLVDENVSIVLKGLEKLRTNPSYNFKRVIETTAKFEGKINSEFLAFYVCPKLNAASRLDNINIALNLLLSEQPEEIEYLCTELENLNLKRKEITEQISNIALTKAIQPSILNTDPVIVYGEDWHKGILGIIASSLAETFNRPAFVFTLDSKTNILHGSCRSFKDLNIMSALDETKDVLLTYGGHAGAAGLSLKLENLDEFKSILSKYYSKYPFDYFSKTISVDLEISFKSISLKNIEKLQSLNPYGEGNKEPIFMTKNVKIKTKKIIGPQKNHMQLALEDSDGQVFTAMCFFSAEYKDILTEGTMLDIVYKLNINEWKGKKTIQLMIEDFHSNIFTPKESTSYIENEMFLSNEIDIAELVEEVPNHYNDILPTKNEYVLVFNTLGFIFNDLNCKNLIINIEVLSKIITLYSGVNFNAFKLFRILDVLYESGNLEYKLFSKGNIIISRTLFGREKTKLSLTNTFKKLQSSLIFNQ